MTNSQINQIKEGDTVICIDDKYSFGRLLAGGEYVANLAYDNKTLVVVSSGAYCCIDRFQLKSSENKE